MKAILDTSVLIAMKPSKFSGEFEISAVSLAELHFGVLASTHPSRRAERIRRLEATQSTFRAIPIDERVAQSYGRLCAVVNASGRSVRSRTMDLLIAATAHARGAALYTRNPKDLVGLERLIDIVAV